MKKYTFWVPFNCGIVQTVEAEDEQEATDKLCFDDISNDELVADGEWGEAELQKVE